MITGACSKTVLVAMSLALTCAAAVHAADSTTAQSHNLSDGNIISLLTIANRSDIEGGQLAQQTGVDPRVKAFAGQMVNDHSAMLEQGPNYPKPR